MIILLQFILVLVIFFPIQYGAYWLTEVKGLPEWLQYKPWICRLCLTFWSLVGVYVAIWLSFSCSYIGVTGLILAALNALAMWVDQRQKTITIEQYDKTNGY